MSDIDSYEFDTSKYTPVPGLKPDKATIADLQAQLLTQSEEIRRLREALEFYEDVKNYDYDAYKGQTLQDAPVGQDEGFKAREALTPTPTTFGQKALDVVEAAIATDNAYVNLGNTYRVPLGELELNLNSALECQHEALSELQKERTNN